MLLPCSVQRTSTALESHLGLCRKLLIVQRCRQTPARCLSAVSHERHAVRGKTVRTLQNPHVLSAELQAVPQDVDPAGLPKRMVAMHVGYVGSNYRGGLRLCRRHFECSQIPMKSA